MHIKFQSVSLENFVNPFDHLESWMTEAIDSLKQCTLSGIKGITQRISHDTHYDYGSVR